MFVTATYWYNSQHPLKFVTCPSVWEPLRKTTPRKTSSTTARHWIYQEVTLKLSTVPEEIFKCVTKFKKILFAPFSNRHK